ncbi:MAG: NADPH-dependent F420 reductase [Bryobacteraceae bacterium]
MNIAILGTGNVGGALGTHWARVGHHVIFGFRDPESAEAKKLLASSGSNANGATVGEAVKAGEVVVAALPWPQVKEILGGLDLNGKILFDCTNPLLPNLAGLEVGTTESGGEQVAVAAAGARVVKVFNTTGFANMADPVYQGKPTVMFYCSDDADAKAVAKRLTSDLGFDAVDAGPLTNARLLEPLALLWIWLANIGGLGRDIAFQLVKR